LVSVATAPPALSEDAVDATKAKAQMQANAALYCDRTVLAMSCCSIWFSAWRMSFIRQPLWFWTDYFLGGGVVAQSFVLVFSCALKIRLETRQTVFGCRS
jgi:hypothetical protein